MEKKKILVLLCVDENPWLVDASCDAIDGLDKVQFEVHVQVLCTHRRAALPMPLNETGISWKELLVDPWFFSVARWLHRFSGLTFLLRYLGRNLHGNYAIGLGVNARPLMELFHINSAKIKRKICWLHADLQAFSWFRRRIADETAEATAFEKRLAKADSLLAGSWQVHRAIGSGLGMSSSLRLVYLPLGRNWVLAGSR